MIRQAETLPADTSQAAAAVQIDTLRAMGLEGRAKLTFELSANLRRITMDGIRHRHPDYTERQVVQAYLSLILDKELFERIFPGCEISA